ncbi:MAG TPA: hypothetical protein VEU52_10365 [Candidatus Limnocylindrales bacterium]|nr:hypothetical protein [Candidatus Limnocylindrales bacterium]
MVDVVGARGFDPLAVVVEVGVDTGGADDDVGVFEGASFGLFQEVFQDAGELLFAAAEEAGGVGMAVDGGSTPEAVFAGDFFGAAPAEEVGFDGVAERVGADGAEAAVMRGRG